MAKAKKKTTSKRKPTHSRPAPAPAVETPVVALTDAELEPLREKVRAAFKSGTRDELDAACQALADAHDPSPPREAYETLQRWGKWPSAV